MVLGGGSVYMFYALNRMRGSGSVGLRETKN